MIHECNRALETAWSAAVSGQGSASPPSPDLLSHAFVCRRWDLDHYAFTHVGPRLSAAHGRQLLDQNILDLWRREDRVRVRDAFESALTLGAPVIVRSHGRQLDGGSIAYEATFWPVAGPNRAVDRLLGAMAPCVDCLGERPVISHCVEEISLIPRAVTANDAPRASELARLFVKAGRA